MLDKIHMSCHEIGLICERKDHKNPSWIERHTKPPPPSLPIVGYWNFQFSQWAGHSPSLQVEQKITSKGHSFVNFYSNFF